MTEIEATDKRNPVRVNDSATDRTTKNFLEGLPSETFTEVERLEEQNVEVDVIDGVDNLFKHHELSGNQAQDRMVGLKYPDFDTFGFIGPALNAAFDAEVARNAFHRDISHLESLKSEVHQPKEHLNNRTTVPQNQVPVGQVSTPEISSLRRVRIHPENAEGGIVMANILLQLSEYDDQSSAREVESYLWAALGDKVYPHNEQHHQIREEPFRPFGTLQENILNESGEGALWRENETRLNGENGHASFVKNFNSYPECAQTFREPKTHACGDREKPFSKKSDPTAHSGTHTGEQSKKLFMCEVCHRCFSFQSALSRHSIVHTNVRPFQCNICMTAFRRKETLSKHMMIKHCAELTDLSSSPI